MSAEDFQLLDNEKIDDSLIKRDFTKKISNLEPTLMLKDYKLNSISVKILILCK